MCASLAVPAVYVCLRDQSVLYLNAPYIVYMRTMMMI